MDRMARALWPGDVLPAITNLTCEGLQVTTQEARPLRRILGLGFGLALAFGGTVGVGLLRLPGTLAAALGNSHAIVLCWIIGGLWSLMGAVAIAELVAMLPLAGGFYIYARRAFGNGFGFVVGWSDWFNQVATMAYAALGGATFLGAMWPATAVAPRAIAITLIGSFAGLHWVGLRLGGTVTRAISVVVGLMLLGLVIACYLVPAVVSSKEVPPTSSTASLPMLSIGMLAAAVTALRAVFVTYDGWYSPIYMAEESTEPGRTMPRAIIGGTLLVSTLYVVFNLAILRIVPLSTLAASAQPAAEAARIILPVGGVQLVSAISLLTALSAVNAMSLLAPRILLAISRDGLFTEKVTRVSEGGTPRIALTMSASAAVGLIISGTFEEIIAISAVLFLLNYVSAYAALIVLRRREPQLPRPYKAFGFPLTTAIVLLGCIILWAAAIAEDHRSALIAGLLLLACAPIYFWIARRRRIDTRLAAGAPPL
jgi:APA family basic amino acid/polyamine antiporter